MTKTEISVRLARLSRLATGPDELALRVAAACIGTKREAEVAHIVRAVDDWGWLVGPQVAPLGARQ